MERKKVLRVLKFVLVGVFTVIVLLFLTSAGSSSTYYEEVQQESETIKGGTEETTQEQQPIRATCESEAQYEYELLFESNYYDESLVVAGGSFQDWCKLAYAEGGSDGEEAMAAVVATTLNRINSPDFPDDFWAVITMEDAYNSVRDGKIWIMTNDPYECTYEMISDELRHYVWLALAYGYDPTETKLREVAVKNGIEDLNQYVGDGALYFYNPDAVSDYEYGLRKSIKCETRIGSQIFYTYWDEP